MDRHFLAYGTEELIEKFWEFLPVYQRRPIAVNEGGIKIEHMFALWFLLTELKPEAVIESGVWFGQSTWLIEQACPEARIHALDPILRPQRHRAARASYATLDFSQHDWHSELEGIPLDRVLCFFDDHHGMARLFQARAAGFRHVVYEDNFAHPGGNFNQDFSPKWILLAHRHQTTPELLCQMVMDFCQKNPGYAEEVLAATTRFSSPDGLRRYAECVDFLADAVEVYCEFPPLLPLDPTRIATAWPTGFRADTAAAIFDRLDLPLAANEFDYNFLAYLALKPTGKDPIHP